MIVVIEHSKVVKDKVNSFYCKKCKTVLHEIAGIYGWMNSPLMPETFFDKPRRIGVTRVIPGQYGIKHIECKDENYQEIMDAILASSES